MTWVGFPEGKCSNVVNLDAVAYLELLNGGGAKLTWSMCALLGLSTKLCVKEGPGYFS